MNKLWTAALLALALLGPARAQTTPDGLVKKI